MKWNEWEWCFTPLGRKYQGENGGSFCHYRCLTMVKRVGWSFRWKFWYFGIACDWWPITSIASFEFRATHFPVFYSLCYSKTTPVLFGCPGLARFPIKPIPNRIMIFITAPKFWKNIANNHKTLEAFSKLIFSFV